MRSAAACTADGPELGRLIEDVESLADRELRSAAALASRLALIPTGLAAERTGALARGLEELRRQVADLTSAPGSGDSVGRWSRIVGRREPGDPYDRRWARARKPIQESVGRLRDSVTRLRLDRARLAGDQLALDNQVGTLMRYADLSRHLDERLSAFIDGGADGDPQKAQALQAELLPVVRRRRQEILMQLAVATQGQAALRILQEDNDALVDAITTATASTLDVLQTVSAVRQALELRRRLGVGRRAAGSTHRGADVPGLDSRDRALAEVGATLNLVESLRRRVLESAAALVQPDLR